MKSKLTPTLHNLASQYSKITGIGLPFSGDDDEMTNALIKSWATESLKLSKLQIKSRIVNQLIEEIKSCE